MKLSNGEGSEALGLVAGELLLFPFLEDLENLQGMNSPARND